MINEVSASILSIGTELTSGQIANTNAQWISQKLSRIGLRVDAHLTLPDDRNLIHQGLERTQTPYLFVTGGLGPTTDDFTRDVIAQWMKRALIFDPASWEHVQNTLKPRGIPLREAQKQQCHFPEGSRILTNRLGTANAFRCEHQGQTLFVLPGPPREGQGIWNEWIAPEMNALSQKLDPIITRSWDTLGMGESEIAHRVEDVTQDCPFEKGYRVHLPYVEVKLSFPRSREKEAEFWRVRIEQALADRTIIRDGQDLAAQLCAHIERIGEVEIQDEVTGSALWARLSNPLREVLKQKKFTFSQRFRHTSGWKLSIQQELEKQVKVSLQTPQKTLERIFVKPQNILAEREPLYFAEMALIFWNETLNQKELS